MAAGAPWEATEAAPPERLERAESLGLSFLLLLERLSAEERAAFLLREVFDYRHAEAAAVLGIAEDACRQRVHRAKIRLREGPTRFNVDPRTQQRLLRRFMAVMEQPSLESLRELFAEDARHTADGGGLVLAARRPLHGADRLARLFLQIALRQNEQVARRELRQLNGAPLLLVWAGETLTAAGWIDTDGERITAIHNLRHPGKLARLQAVTETRPDPSLH